MGDVSKFSGVMEFYLFNAAFGLFCASEFLIWLFTSVRQAMNGKRANRDATLWLVLSGCAGSVWLSFFFRSRSVSPAIRGLLLPRAFFWIGIALLLGGIVLRGLSVRTLQSAFTLNVQTAEDQHLITKGPYRLIRNPSYTGGILSLLGVAFCLRSVFAPFAVAALCALCYGIRIRKEEKALSLRFGQEFENYKQHTWRLFPGL